jgi:poly-gamma-glutamate system protein
MKKIYWRPRAVSRPALLLIALISLAGLSVVERYKVENPQPYFQEKQAAAQLAKRAFEVIKAERMSLGPAYQIDPRIDPSESGLIGVPMSPVTTVSGEVSAKQTSANPNFAAVIVEMLKDANVQQGDVVAVGCSGSFPALNICTYAACEVLGVKPLVISSASASQWGANIPGLLWPDMERVLRQKGVFSVTSIACSIGGYQDRGLGLSEEGRRLVMGSIESNGLQPFRAEEEMPNVEDVVANMEEDFKANVDERMKLYEQHAQGQPIRAYINVGGGTVSVGRNVGKLMFRPGLNLRPPRHVREIDGVMPQFINQGVPVIHVVHINALADRYTLPLEPTEQPPIGHGGVFYGIDYSKPLVIGVLAFILLSLYAFIRSDVGFRILRASQRSRKGDAAPEPMV